MSLIIMLGTSSNALSKPSCPFELIVYIFGERIVQSGIFYGKYGLVMFESYFLLETYLLFQHTSGIYGYRLAEQFEASETHCGKRNAGEWTSPFHRRYVRIETVQPLSINGYPEPVLVVWLSSRLEQLNRVF